MNGQRADLLVRDEAFEVGADVHAWIEENLKEKARLVELLMLNGRPIADVMRELGMTDEQIILSELRDPETGLLP